MTQREACVPGWNDNGDGRQRVFLLQGVNETPKEGRKLVGKVIEEDPGFAVQNADTSADVSHTLDHREPTQRRHQRGLAETNERLSAGGRAPAPSSVVPPARQARPACHIGACP